MHGSQSFFPSFSAENKPEKKAENLRFQKYYLYVFNLRFVFQTFIDSFCSQSIIV